MNELSLNELTIKCKDLENQISKERNRLQATEEILTQFNGYAELEEEQAKNQVLEEEISKFREKVQKVRDEYENLRAGIAAKEQEMTEMGKDLDNKRRRSSALAAEVDIWRCENAKLEKQIQKIRDLNARRDSENEKSMEELAKSPDPWLIIQQGRFKSEESTIKEEREKLILFDQKLESQISQLFQKLGELHEECKKREKSANDTYYAVQKIMSAERHYINPPVQEEITELPDDGFEVSS